MKNILKHFFCFLPVFLQNFIIKNIKKDTNPYKHYNDKYQAIFIHIPKTAGISLESGLFKEKVGHSFLWKYKVFNKKNLMNISNLHLLEIHGIGLSLLTFS